MQLKKLIADFKQGERDYKNMPAHIPTIKANLPVGHMATYGETHGGQFGKAAALFFKWQMKGDAQAGAQFLNPAGSPLTSAGWQIVHRNFKETTRMVANITEEAV